MTNVQLTLFDEPLPPKALSLQERLAPFVGSTYEFFSVAAAIEFIDQYSIHEGPGGFRRCQVRVALSNGEKAEASLSSQEKVREFLEFFGRKGDV